MPPKVEKKKLSDPFVPGVKKGGALGVKRVAGWVKKSVTRGKREWHWGCKRVAPGVTLFDPLLLPFLTPSWF